MKTYVIDWGENATGGRYALIQANSLIDAFWDADAVSSPFSIAELKIPRDCEGVRYLEITSRKPYEGSTMDALKWQSSGDIFLETEQIFRK